MATAKIVKIEKTTLFNYPSRKGTHRAASTFTTSEPRFQWQDSGQSSGDAMYVLPSTLGGNVIQFCTSTREDWDTKPKKSNPCAGPGSYRMPTACGKQILSDNRTCQTISFAEASRVPKSDNTTPSPGPVYNLPEYTGSEIENAPSFGTALRPPLYGTAEGPGPSIVLPSAFKKHRQGVRSSFGSQIRMSESSSTRNFPGPIYNVDCTGFKTGSSVSFSHGRRF